MDGTDKLQNTLARWKEEYKTNRGKTEIRWEDIKMLEEKLSEAHTMQYRFEQHIKQAEKWVVEL